MKITSLLTLSTAFVAAATLNFSSHAADDEEVIEKAMKTYHKAPKGTEPVAKKAAAGTATKEEVADLLKAYESMAEVKPPRGDADEWNKRLATLIAATKDLHEGKDGAVDTFKEAGNCKSCHTDHKPE